MNMLRAVAVILPAVCIGILVLHLLWNESQISALFVKLFMGIGVGLGLGSLLYFLYLLVFAGSHFFLFLESGILVTLLLLTIRRERTRVRIARPAVHMNYWQVALLAVVLLAIAFSISGALTVWNHRPSGTWDAYMIYNRTARFVYRGQADWLQSFSRKLDPVFHADYPLLLPLSIASSWDALGRESPHVPLLLSGTLMVVCAGLFASGLALVKSVSQAGVGLLILLNTPLFVITGASQTADVPLAFFILATAILVYLYASQQQPGLLVLAGLTSGLAGWTKNEGQLFLVVTGVSLFLAFMRSGPWPRLGFYLLGLLLPLAVITYFKLFLAPPNDLLGGGFLGAIQSSLDWQRHVTILGNYGEGLVSFGRSWIGVGPILLVYAVIFGSGPRNASKRAHGIIVLMLALQLTGYYFVYLITPHPVSWQLEFSLERLLLQVYLAALFLLFAILRDVRTLWDARECPNSPARAA
jgi:hypothetical protein